MVDKNELSKRIADTIKSVTHPVNDSEFKFKDDANMNKLVIKLSESISMMIGSNQDRLKCKGFRIYFVDEESGVLVSEGMFVKDFIPEDWNEK